MAGKITDYPTTTTLIDEDLFDTSKWDGVSAFTSTSVKWEDILKELQTQLTFNNLYNNNGTLAGNRIVSMGVNDLTFGSTGEANLLKFETTNDRIGIGTAAPTERLEIVGNTKITGGIDVDLSTFFVNGTTHAWSLGRSATPDTSIPDAVTIGYQANTLGSGRSIAIGRSASAVASGVSSNIAIGYQAKALSGDNVIMIGDECGGGAIATYGSQSLLIGYQGGRAAGAVSTGVGTIAIGDRTDASGTQATILGSAAKGTANWAIAIGRGADSLHSNGIAIGLRAETGAARAYVIASGLTGTVNSVADSLAVGFNEATPRFLFSKSADSYLNGTGNVGIGTTTPSDKLEVSGNLNATRYKVNGVAGANFTGAVTNITVVDGLVTAVS